MRKYLRVLKTNKISYVFKALLLGVGLCLFTNCKHFIKTTDENVVVRVGDNVLLKSELDKMIPLGSSGKDSLLLAEKIIKQWVRQNVLLKKANDNQVESDYPLEIRVEEYKNSLIIYSYQNRVLEQYLDTNVSDKEIETYYNENPAQFYLKSNIVRVRFVKVKKDTRWVNKIKKTIFSEPFTDEELKELSALCDKGAENYYLDEEQWLFFNDLLREVPIQTYNQEDFLKNNRNIEISSGDYIYYLVIVDFKVRDMVSPLKFETDRIRKIILNHRKQEILSKMQTELMQEANAKKWIKYE